MLLSAISPFCSVMYQTLLSFIRKKGKILEGNAKQINAFKIFAIQFLLCAKIKIFVHTAFVFDVILTCALINIQGVKELAYAY